jgi:hypothetical protein
MTLRALLAAASLAVATAAAADQAKAEQDLRKGITGQPGKYGSAGCGLGAMAFKDQHGGIQIIAATLNGICANQTFGITFGTSNCGPSVFAQGTRNFVEANREVLAKDIARGEGEAVGALTVINACPDSRAVGAALQRRFSAIFPSSDATDGQVTDAILETLHADPNLGCGKG